jgi:hypothetical protein
LQATTSAIAPARPASLILLCIRRDAPFID